MVDQTFVIALRSVVLLFSFADKLAGVLMLISGRLPHFWLIKGGPRSLALAVRMRSYTR